MATIRYASQFSLPALQSISQKVLRCGAENMDIEIRNSGVNALTYTVNDVLMWNNHLDDIFKTIPAQDTGQWRALGALDYVPMHTGTLVNLGAAGGTGTLIAGAIGNTNPPINAEANIPTYQVSNGYFLIANAGQYCAYDGPWTIGMWIYPTLVSLLTPLYQENNVSASHYFQIFLDTDRRIGFRMSNVATTFSVKDAAGPQVPLNQWSLVICTYTTPNFTYTIAPNSISTPASVGGGGMATFGDGAARYVGLIGSTNGYIAMPFSFNNATYNGETTAPLTTQMRTYIYDEWIQSYGFNLPIDSGTLAGGANFIKSYGKGTPNPFPAVTVVQLLGGGATNTDGALVISVGKES